MLNDKKMSFIICYNNKQYLDKCIFYINNLKIPKGYSIEIKPVTGAPSMASGYNKGMQESDAKYKVYLHQNVFIWNKKFIEDILLEFSKNKGIGMMGVLGGVNLPGNGIIYNAWNAGITYECDTQNAGVKKGIQPEYGEVKAVEALDGLLLATQYDLVWREDICKGWDFYDISQSFEFRRAGYHVVVPYQKEPWCMHDCGKTNLQSYNVGRKKLLKEYPDFFHNPIYREEDFIYNYEKKRKIDKLRENIINSMQLDDYHKANKLCSVFDDSVIEDSGLSILSKLVVVCEIERQLFGESRAFQKGEKWETVYERFSALKFMLWDCERERLDFYPKMERYIIENQISSPFLVMTGIHNMFHFKEVFPFFLELYVKHEKKEDYAYLELISRQLGLLAPYKTKEGLVSKLPEDDDDRFYNITEQKIQEFERGCVEKSAVWQRFEQEYEQKINYFLKIRDRDSLLEVLEDEDFFHKFETHTDMAYMILAGQIYRAELEDGVSYTIFDGRESIEAVENHIRRLKFLLWHLEFKTSDSAGVELLSFIQHEQISIVLLKYMVHTMGMDKVFLLASLADLFLERNMFGASFAVLKYADELLPGQEDILCSMADLCIKIGKKKEAVQCLDKIERPGRIAQAFRKLCET